MNETSLQVNEETYLTQGTAVWGNIKNHGELHMPVDFAQRESHLLEAFEVQGEHWGQL
jgi:hypothetical protein